MEILREIEKILKELWDKLYVFLCEYFGEEVNEDWFIADNDESIFN